MSEHDKEWEAFSDARYKYSWITKENEIDFEGLAEHMWNSALTYALSPSDPKPVVSEDEAICAVNNYGRTDGIATPIEAWIFETKAALSVIEPVLREALAAFSYASGRCTPEVQPSIDKQITTLRSILGEPV